jgi:hypothetical protein
MRLRFFAFVLALPLLTSCAGGGSTSGPVLQQSADSMQDTASVSERDALRIAQTSDTSHETLSVQPPSLTLVLPYRTEADGHGHAQDDRCGGFG